MEAKTQVRVASLLVFALGVWVAVSPIFISVTGTALGSTIAGGVALAVLGLSQLFMHSSVASWLSCLVGIWFVVSAFALTVSTAMTWNLVLVGIAAAIAALWDTNEVGQAYHPMRT